MLVHEREFRREREPAVTCELAYGVPLSDTLTDESEGHVRCQQERNSSRDVDAGNI